MAVDPFLWWVGGRPVSLAFFIFFLFLDLNNLFYLVVLCSELLCLVYFELISKNLLSVLYASFLSICCSSQILNHQPWPLKSLDLHPRISFDGVFCCCLVALNLQFTLFGRIMATFIARVTCPTHFPFIHLVDWSSSWRCWLYEDAKTVGRRQHFSYFNSRVFSLKFVVISLFGPVHCIFC